MGLGGFWHWLVLIAVIAVLFGPKRIPALMTDLAGGIRAFRRGLAAPDEPPPGSTPPGNPAGTTERKPSDG
jgi:sec-independent protein translocase protein TatA